MKYSADIFGLDDISIGESGVLKYLTIIVLGLSVTISPEELV
jgi:hypothetical protein